MIQDEPKVADTSRYSITEVANILQMDVSTIRRLTHSGHIKCGYWRHNGRKFYTGRDIKRFFNAKL